MKLNASKIVFYFKRHLLPNPVLLFMQLTVFLLLFSSLQLCATGYGQVVNLNASNASLENVFKKIKKETGYRFFYENEAVFESYGYSRDEWSKMTVINIRPEEDHQQIKDFAKENLELVI